MTSAQKAWEKEAVAIVEAEGLTVKKVERSGIGLTLHLERDGVSFIAHATKNPKTAACRKIFRRYIRRRMRELGFLVT